MGQLEKWIYRIEPGIWLDISATFPLYNGDTVKKMIWSGYAGKYIPEPGRWVGIRGHLVHLDD